MITYIIKIINKLFLLRDLIIKLAPSDLTDAWIICYETLFNNICVKGRLRADEFSINQTVPLYPFGNLGK